MSDTGIRLYAAALAVKPEEVAAFVVRYRAHPRNSMIERLAVAAEAIIAERVREARDYEREKVADFLLARSFVTGHGDTTEDLLSELGAQITEREAAARREALREAYNAVCGEFEPPVMSFAEDPEEKGYHTGVTACRDAIAKLIEGEAE